MNSSSFLELRFGGKKVPGVLTYGGLICWGDLILRGGGIKAGVSLLAQYLTVYLPRLCQIGCTSAGVDLP